MKWNMYLVCEMADLLTLRCLNVIQKGHVKGPLFVLIKRDREKLWSVLTLNTLHNYIGKKL